MKNVFFLGLFLASFLFTAAQSDSRAIEILDKVSEKTRSFNTISAKFILTLEDKEIDFYEEDEGTINLKGQKYVVDLPGFGVNIYSDGNTIWNYMEDGNQVTISNVEDNSSELMDPSTVFRFYEKGFQSKYIGEIRKDNTTYYQIELYPDTEEHEVSKILLLIDKSEMMISSAVLHGTDGHLNGIVVKEMDTTVELPDSYFVFDPAAYGDIVIIDFRLQ